MRRNALTRRSALRLLSTAGIGAAFLPLGTAPTAARSISATTMRTRTIPSSNEHLPVVGLGTWQQFDVGTSPEERGPLLEVLSRMNELGGTVIDTSPMYGRAEETVGALTQQSGSADKFFYATKVWTTGEQDGIDQMNASMRKMRRASMDLMQIHNLLDWKTHVKTLEAWKAEGKVRYTGITHYTVSAHDELERIVAMKGVDFVQCNYSLRVRNAERSLLRAAADNGVAVIINEPFEKGALFGAVRGTPLPEWSAEYGIRSWAQYFLKFILSHPAVTCVIPGTSNPKHAADNVGAGIGDLPDAAGRKRMVEFIESL